MKKQDHEVITLFYGKYISPEYIDILVEKINALTYEVEIAIVPTYETVYDITLNFE